MRNFNNFNNLNNEGADGFIPSDPREETIEKELKAMRQAWTLEVTKERRAAWNAEITSYKTAGKKISQSELAKIEKRMGFMFVDLKRAIVKHGL